MKIYTRSGDEGETGLFGGQRVKKHHPRVEAYGAVDELNAVLGMAVAAIEAHASAPSTADDVRHGLFSEGDIDPLAAAIRRVQNRLFDLGADLATPPEGATGDWLSRVDPAWTRALETEIDGFEAELDPLSTFILPGGTASSASLHLARTVCRRAERRAVEARDTGEVITKEAITFLNRLSDWLFVAARLANARAGEPDRPWKREP
jgi:cob(I)alamin adenosyltransferase